MGARLLHLILAPSLLGTISAPVIQNTSQLSQTSQKVHHYFFRLPLLSIQENAKKDEKLINEDKNRLDSYYKKYHSLPSHLNRIDKWGFSGMEGSGNPNFFIHIQNPKFVENRDWEWLKTVKLNQLTIDRTFEKKMQDTELTPANLFKTLLETKNWLPEYFKLARNPQNQDAIDLYFKDTKLSAEEIRRLVYFPSDQIGDKKWFVWFDKDLLQLKLNFGFQIWFFNQPFLKKEPFIQDLYNSARNRKHKWELRKRIKSLYKQLTDEEKELFEFFYHEMWIQRSDNRLGSLRLKPEEITSEDINKLYKLLKEKAKNTDIFKGHLVQIIQGGDKRGFESFFPSYVTYATGPDALYEVEESKGYNKNTKVTVTPDKSIDKDWDAAKLLDILKNHSVKNFTLRTTDNSKKMWPSIILDSNSVDYFSIIRESYISAENTI
ncbi:hypothetical protein [Candidatus Mycoplasma haematominutum]|uniref:hypothetical protein n=1 Tax=Candidatus Mycoplasma haematominutum TaxID=209446 RepID=UPI0005C51E67|nr:hypothetical protein [Candidatus Mycoplasma haematominutum]